MIRGFIYAGLFSIAVSASFAGEKRALTDPREKTVFDIDNAVDVDRALAATLTSREPPIDVRTISTAWKDIVAESVRAPIKIIIDTDIGTDVDDAFALAFALRRPELQVCAITTSRGEVEKRAAIVSRLLQIAGRDEVPFAPGSPTLFRGAVMADKVVNQFPFAGTQDGRPPSSAEDAQELFRQVVSADPGNVWLVVIGPMTNAAILIRDHPDIAAKLRGIVCMGGEPARGAAETNIKNDPEAAQVVCRSGLLKFAGTDDVTRHLLVPLPAIQRFQRTPTPLARGLVELFKLWRTQEPPKFGPVVFDLAPIVWLFAPDLIPTETKGLAVNEAGIMRFAGESPPCAVSTDVDAVAVYRLMMDTLTR